MILKKKILNLDDFLIFLILGFSLFVLFSTELLSFFDSIYFETIITLWVIFFGLLIIIKRKFIEINYDLIFKIKSFHNVEKICLYFISLIFCITFLISIIYPPNTPDSMSYHMPRVMQWIQNQEVDFYPTSVTRQLYMSPLSGYFIMHLYLIIGNDLAVNLVQWFAMLISVITTFFIVKLYTKNILPNLIAMLFCSTIPMGILQSTSTQIDYVVSMWLIIMIFFLFKYKFEQKFIYITGFGISLSLAILTKQTSFIFAFPFCIYFLFVCLKNKRQDFIKLFIIPIIILLVNYNHIKRNYETFGSLIGINEHSSPVLNEKMNLKNFSSNVVRNLSLNFTLPNSNFNENLRKTVRNFHEIIGQDINSSETTFNKNDYFVYFSLYETRASNTLHFILILFFILLFFVKNKKFFFLKSYLFSLISGFLLFAIILKWQPWGNRLLLPFFVTSSPLIGIYLDRLNNFKLNLIIMFFLSIYSLPYVFSNDLRPLIVKITNHDHKIKFEKPYFLINKREKLYFTYNLKMYENYEYIKKISKKIKCKNFGIISKENTWEYPYWKMLKEINANIDLKHLNVNNPSKKFKKNNSIPCFVVEFYPDKTKYKSLDHLKNQEKLHDMKIYY